MSLDDYLSPDPRKRSVERTWLLYTPVWGVLAGIVMVGGFAEWLSDLPLFLFGLVVGLGAVVLPILRRPPEDRDVPWYRSTAATMGLSVVLLSFGLNYTQTPFFWDVLHMHYGFPSTWLIDENPIFLYLLTVAYFATYAALTLMTLRAIRRALASRPRVATVLGFSLAPMAMAFLETAMNANPFMTRLFCYDDMRLMLTFGTVSYGVAFVYALPMWFGIDEVPGAPRVPPGRVVIWAFAALYADLLTLDLLRYHVAPHLTVVETDAHNLRDFGEGCLPAREAPDTEGAP